MKVVTTLAGIDNSRRILIVERDDGTFMLVEQKWYRNVYERRLIAEGWRSFGPGPSFFETVEIAEREAHAQFPWLHAAQ